MSEEEIEKWLEKQENIIWGTNLVEALSVLFKNYISKDKIKEFYKKYISESLKDFSPYEKDNSTSEKERKAGEIRILRLIEKDLLKENNNE